MIAREGSWREAACRKKSLVTPGKHYSRKVIYTSGLPGNQSPMEVSIWSTLSNHSLLLLSSLLCASLSLPTPNKGSQCPNCLPPWHVSWERQKRSIVLNVSLNPWEREGQLFVPEAKQKLKPGTLEQLVLVCGGVRGKGITPESRGLGFRQAKGLVLGFR